MFVCLLSLGPPCPRPVDGDVPTTVGLYYLSLLSPTVSSYRVAWTDAVSYNNESFVLASVAVFGNGSTFTGVSAYAVPVASIVGAEGLALARNRSGTCPASRAPWLTPCQASALAGSVRGSCCTHAEPLRAVRVCVPAHAAQCCNVAGSPYYTACAAPTPYNASACAVSGLASLSCRNYGPSTPSPCALPVSPSTSPIVAPVVPPTGSSSSVVIIAAAAGGGGALLIALLLFAAVVYRRRKAQQDGRCERL